MLSYSSLINSQSLLPTYIVKKLNKPNRRNYRYFFRVSGRVFANNKEVTPAGEAWLFFIIISKLIFVRINSQSLGRTADDLLSATCHTLHLMEGCILSQINQKVLPNEECTVLRKMYRTSNATFIKFGHFTEFLFRFKL